MTVARIEDVSALARVFGQEMGALEGQVSRTQAVQAEVAVVLPNIRTTHRQWGLTDTFTLTPADDWQSIIEAYDGAGTITLADGVYTATRRLKPRGKPFLRAATLGGAKIVANWEFLQGTGARFWEVDLEPQDKTDLWLRATMAYVDFRDARIFAGDASFTMAQFASCAFSDIRFTASQRDVLVDLGPNIGEGWDFDSSTNVKVAGNTTDKRVKLLNRVPDGSSRQMWVFDQSRMICDGLHVINPNTGVKGGIGINARRNSLLTFQQSSAVTGYNNRITEQVRGLILRQNSAASFQGTYLALNGIGIQPQDGGFFSHATGGLTFVNNTTDVDNQNASAGVVVTGLPSRTTLGFSGGATTIAAGTTAYMGLAYLGTDLAIARMRVPRDGRLRNLSVRSSLAPGAGQSFTAILYRGSADSPLSAVIADTNTSAADLTNGVPVVAGDVICVKVVSSAGAAARAITATVDLE